MIVYGIFHAFLFILAGYIFFKVTLSFLKKSEYYIFRALIISFWFYLIMNILWTLQEFDVLHMSRGVFTTVCVFSYLGVMFIAFFFYAFTMDHFNFDLGKKSLATMLGLLPITAAFVLLMISLKNGMIFYIDENVHLKMGSAYIALPVCAFMYFAVIARVSIFRLIKTKGKYAKKECIVLLFCVLFLTGWVLLDGIIDRGVTIIPIATYSVINFLFVHMLSSKIYTDALTDMNNRRKAEEYLLSQIESVSELSPLFIYIADVNGFKQINDTFGHIEGDYALVLVSDAIKNAVKRHNGFAARYGGDEFIWAIRPEKDEEYDPEVIAKEMQSALDEACKEKGKKYTLSLCVGYVRCVDRKKTVSDYLNEADKKLYARKKKIHSTMFFH